MNNIELLKLKFNNFIETFEKINKYIDLIKIISKI